MPPDSITLTCNDVPVPIERVDVDNKFMTEEDEFGQYVELFCALQTKCRRSSCKKNSTNKCKTMKLLHF
eukprot:1512453-Lingulodinium_polyedra.AAC.1